MDFQRPHTPDDSIQHAPSPLDDPMSFQRDPDNQHGFPFDPPADEDSEDEDNEDIFIVRIGLFLFNIKFRNSLCVY